MKCRTRCVSFWILWIVCFSLLGQSLGAEPMVEAFVSPPNETKPWCYYFVLKGNLTREQITLDFQAMAEKGFGGVLVVDSRYYYDEFDSKEHVPVPIHVRHEFMSESWQELILFLIQEADRLGMRVSLNIANSGGMLRGPWDMGGDGPKELIWTEENVDGPKNVSIPLDTPAGKNFYSDVALVAVRVTSPVSQGREEIKLNRDWYPVSDPAEDAATVGETRDLRQFVQNGRLSWSVPEGHWKIIRFGFHVVGDFGAVDILNEQAIEGYFHRFADPILERARPYVGKTLTHFYNVSWEGSHPNWTHGMDRFFEEWNGYSMAPFWGVLRGLCVENREVSRRFLVDYYRTVSRCFQEHCYAKIGKLCHEKGILWHSEDGGPWRRTAPIFRESDMLTFWGQNDIAQGEFWVNTHDATRTRSNMRFAAMSSNLYGHRETACEAFTHMTKHWTMYPAWLKPAADVNFIDGMNFVVWHTYTASPPEHGVPGLEYFAGTHVNRNVTWFPYVEGFLTYIGRCQYLLRQGTFVADAAAYVSDKNYVDWGRGEKWNKDSTLVLPKGFAWDFLDTPSLLRMECRDGMLVLPSGMSYRMLIVDPLEEEMPLEALRKIESLQKSGAKIVFGQKRPLRERGLRHYPNGDAEIQQIVARIWTPADTIPLEGLAPDFEGNFQYHHRKIDGMNLYFVTGSGTSLCTFRDAAAEALRWDAVSGEVRKITLTPTPDGRFQTTIALPTHGSAFLLFGSEQKPNAPALSETASDALKTHEAEGVFLRLDAPWTVRFDPRWGGPESVEWETLLDWTQHPDDGVRYYSGTAVYSQTFQSTLLSDEPSDVPVVLSLGKVCHIARVRLNGEDLGVVWTAPWEIDISRALRKGENHLEIEVANVWANRLIGDALLPPEERFTRSNMYLYEKPGDIPEGGTRKFMPWQGFHKEDVPMSSGLLGPVLIKAPSRFLSQHSKEYDEYKVFSP
ncbi:MAG: glycosyl hydrolase [Planctomycetia bacterium]|nr:glycosyl hydrolase [Planctomycetia bacterium]